MKTYYKAVIRDLPLPSYNPPLTFTKIEKQVMTDYETIIYLESQIETWKGKYTKILDIFKDFLSPEMIEAIIDLEKEGLNSTVIGNIHENIKE